MIKWLRSIRTALAIAAGLFAAAMLVERARSSKKVAEHWQGVAKDEAQSDRDDAIRRSNAAMTAAKYHDAKAEEALRKGEQKLTEAASRDEDIADIVDRWRRG